MKYKYLVAGLLAATALTTAAHATDLEVTHWWTSGGEAAAVAEMAKAFDASGDHWIDGAIAGSGGTARPIIISRILGGDPMGATQLNHGLQAQELIEAGLLQDLTDVADAEGWKDLVNPSSLLEACTYEGKIYCVPVNIHSAQWLWLSNAAFAKAGVPVPTTWDEFVAAGPALEAAGIVPLAMGQQPWQTRLAFDNLGLAVGGLDAYKAVNIDKNAEVAAGPEYAKVFEAAVAARALAANSNVQDWNQATNLVITGAAGGQLMGDWAQGEFQVAGQKAGTDYTCLPGLGVNKYIATGGDAFYFPVNKDPEVTAAQKRLASILISKELQVAFNLKKGSLPIRGDVDLATANDCMKQGLEILAAGNVLPSTDELFTPDQGGQIEDLMVEFFNSTTMTAAEAQEKYTAIIAAAAQ
jgi:glucose/mannose transport system substrate-binding protein